jgi:hypothetical protein
VSFAPQFARLVKGNGSGAVESVIRVTGITNKLLVFSVGLPFGWASTSMLGLIGGLMADT